MESITLASGPSPLDLLIGDSPAMRQLKWDIERAARCDCTILIRGETGTGKMLVARALHELGPRRSKPFVHVNCGAIPDGLIESELFGHIKGAFTGAYAGKKGFFEAAHGGMIFLDEVAEMNPSVQVKVLHTLQERKYLPVGATAEREVDALIITATHQDLETAVAGRRLREDFYYRINEVTLRIPPLRERASDLPILAQYFLSKIWSKVGLGRPARITCEAVAVLTDYDWPGNVRQLEKMITSLSFNTTDGVITASQVRAEIAKVYVVDRPLSNDLRDWSLDDFICSQERQRLAFIRRAVELEEGNVTAAAERLKINRTTLYKMRGRLAKRAG